MYSKEINLVKYLNVKAKSNKHYISITLQVGNFGGFQIANNVNKNKTYVKEKANNI